MRLRLWPPNGQARMATVHRFGIELDPTRTSPPSAEGQSRSAASHASMAGFPACGKGVMTDSEPTIITAADSVAEFNRIREAVDELMGRAGAIVARLQEGSPEAQDDGLPDDLMRPGDVIHEFGVPRSTLHRLCRENPLGSPGGFAFFDPVKQRHMISRSRFTAYCRRHGTSWDVKPR